MKTKTKPKCTAKNILKDVLMLIKRGWLKGDLTGTGFDDLGYKAAHDDKDCGFCIMGALGCSFDYLSGLQLPYYKSVDEDAMKIVVPLKTAEGLGPTPYPDMILKTEEPKDIGCTKAEMKSLQTAFDALYKCVPSIQEAMDAGGGDALHAESRGLSTRQDQMVGFNDDQESREEIIEQVKCAIAHT